jgi:small-conductance mechanosensitive channel
MTYQIFCFEVGLVSLVCSLIFMRLTILIFRYNIEAFAKQEKEDEKRMEDIHTILLDIYKKNNHL